MFQVYFFYRYLNSYLNRDFQLAVDSDLVFELAEETPWLATPLINRLHANASSKKLSLVAAVDQEIPSGTKNIFAQLLSSVPQEASYNDVLTACKLAAPAANTGVNQGEVTIQPPPSILSSGFKTNR